MIDLVGAFITRAIDRRGFLKAMTSAGFTLLAAPPYPSPTPSQLVA